jgi:hypothetical protein
MIKLSEAAAFEKAARQNYQSSDRGGAYQASHPDTDWQSTTVMRLLRRFELRCRNRPGFDCRASTIFGRAGN